jgi:hypothetical protein
MRPLRILAAGTLLAGLASLALLAMLAGMRSGGTYEAVALSPTPAPPRIEWNVEIAGQPVAGRTVQVSSIAMPVPWGPSYPGHVEEPVYRVTVAGDAPPLQIAGAAEVAPDDVLDGAAWELLALRDGAATLMFRLDYTLSYCLTGTPCGSYDVNESTTENVAVKALLGDASCDGSVDPRDAALVLQLEAALIETLSCAAGDTNDDGLTNSVDAGMILRYSAGLLLELEGRFTG